MTTRQKNVIKATQGRLDRIAMLADKAYVNLVEAFPGYGNDEGVRLVTANLADATKRAADAYRRRADYLLRDA